MNLTKYSISLVDQQTMNPQHTIIDVSVALRLALLEAVLSVGITCITIYNELITIIIIITSSSCSFISNLSK